MNFEQIKTLTINEFVMHNAAVWNAIQALSIEEIIQLKNDGFNEHDVNSDEGVKYSLYEILQEKIEAHIKITIVDKLTDEQKKMLAFLFSDMYSAWNSLEKWNLTNGNI